MPSSLLVQFLITVATFVAAILTLAFLFVTLSPWLQHCIKAMRKALAPNSQP